MSADAESQVADSASCPTCNREFENRHGMRIHHATAHGESLVQRTATCDHCGESFEVSAGSTGVYCSNECNAKGLRNRVVIECEYCGDEFEAEAKVAEGGRKYCSLDCYGASMRDRTDRVCEGCGREFGVYNSAGIRYCSRACMAEDRTSKPRPDDFDGLLWLLYVYEDHNVRDTWLRVNANREEWVVQDEVRERLRENDWMKPGGAPKYGDLSFDDLDVDGPDAPAGDDTWQKYQYDRGESA